MERPSTIDPIGKTGTAIGSAKPVQIQDRIRELRRVNARDLLPNPKNWRRHPKAQVEALSGLLTEIGYADALLARELPDGRLMLIDGHLRAETTPASIVPVLVLDVTDAEADKILLTLDPLTTMAESDAERIETLLQTVRTDDSAVEGLRAAPQEHSCGISSIRKPSHRRRSTRRANYKRSGEPRPGNYGRSEITGCCAAMPPVPTM